MAKSVLRLRPNSGKKLTVEIDGQKYARYPLKTHVVMRGDRLFEDVVSKYAAAYLLTGDYLVISERVVAITQGRAIPIEAIRPSLVANFLVRFVYKPSWGIGIGSPWTMEMAIREAGLWRIIIGGLVAAVTRPFGVRGLFYEIVGHGVNAIDGPTDYTMPPYNRYATLGPKEPDRVAWQVKDQIYKSQKVNVGVVIIDANDIGVRIEGSSDGVDRALVCHMFKDNPLGQKREGTPMAIVRSR